LRGVLARVLFPGLAGVAAGLAFPPFHLWLLLPIAVAGLALGARDLTPRQGFLAGTCFGMGFLLLLIPWLRIVGTDAWIALSLMESLFYGLLGWGLVRLSRLPGWPVWEACAWVAVEALRGVIPWGGFNWGRLAFSAIDTPVAPIVTYAGAAGVTFLIALVGGLLAWAVLHGRSAGSCLAAVGAAGLACSPLLLPGWSLPTDSDFRTVAVVQGNVPGEGLEAFAERRAVLNNHVQATEDLAERVAEGQVKHPDLVIWPENSTDIDPFEDPSVMRDISTVVNLVNAPTLVGAMVRGPGPIDVKNEGIVWVPSVGPTNYYAKMHPVPFGEYIPMRKFLAKRIQRLNEIPRDMVPGTRLGLLKLGDTTIGDVICFEVIYDDLIRAVVNQGAQLLVVQTNNATYMGTGQVDQQFAIARLRAMETHRYVAVAATDGISAMIDPNGKVVTRAQKRTQAVLVESVPRLTSITPAVRWGAWIERGMIAVGLLAIGASLTVQRRQPASDRHVVHHAETVSAGTTGDS
jgi:apolipoprotein N-acyltransferase